MSMFQDKGSFYLTLAGIVFTDISPFVFDSYIISLLIYIGFYGIAALGLNILVGLHWADISRSCSIFWVWSICIGMVK